MKTKNKTLALVEIAIVCSMLLAALPVISAEQTTYEVSASEVTTASEDDFVLGIYGNANEDDTIDMRDVTYTKLIIFGKKTETELADAYYDDEVDVLDVVQIKLIILGRESELTFVDSADRIVTVSMPVERIVVLNSDTARAIRILGVEDRVVGVVDTVYNFPFYFPEMCTKPSVGTWREFDWEKIVALETDLVISYISKVASVEENLEPFGITVVGLDLYVTDPYEKIFDELGVLAILLGKEEKAQKYIDWHDEYKTLVEDLVKDEEKPKVYMTSTAGVIGKTTEVKAAGPGSIGYTLCEIAGSESITSDLTEGKWGYYTVSAEWVLEKNPEIMIVKTGYLFGWWDDEATPKKIRDEALEGKGWDNMNAVVNNKVYVVPWSITSGLEHAYGFVLLAKIFHPEIDIDPTEVYKEFLEEFLRVEYPEGKVLVYPPLPS